MPGYTLFVPSGSRSWDGVEFEVNYTFNFLLLTKVKY